MLWPSKLLENLAYPGPTAGWLARPENATWWDDIRLSQFSALQVAGCVLYLDPTNSDAVVLANASIANAADLHSASWTHTNVTPSYNQDGLGGTQFTVSSAGQPGPRQTIASCGFNATVNPPLTITVKYKAGTAPFLLVAPRVSTAANCSWLNLSTHTWATQGANHSGHTVSAVDPDGYRTATLVMNACGAAPVFQLGITNADNTTTGTVGHTIWLKDATVDQPRVGSLVNLASGVLWTQATASNQPGYEAAGLNSTPAIRSYSSAAQYILSTEAAVLAALNGADPAYTIIYAIKYHVVDNVVFSVGDSGSTNHWSYVGAGASGLRASAQRRDGTTTLTAQSGTNALNTTPCVQEWYTSSSGQAISHQRDGGAANPSAAALDAATLTANRCGLLTWARSTPSAGANASLGRIAIWPRVLTTEERSFVRRGFAQESGISVTA